MRWVLGVTLGLSMSACGADGEPVQPTRNATITLSDNGIGATGQVGVQKGPVSITLGLGF